MRIGFLIAGLAVAAALILGLNYYWRSETAAVPEPEVISTPEPILEREPPESAVTGIIEETPPSPVVEEPVLVLPTLDESDPFFRERLAESLLPEIWLDREDLLRRLAVVIENATRGEIPRRQLAFIAPEGKFTVHQVGESIYVDPSSFERYDRYLDMLESVSPDQVAELLTDAYPLLDQALAELGRSESLLPQVLAAIDQILAVPVLEGDVELIQPKVFYEYADPALEALSPLQKQVLRMGPDNAGRLKAYLLSLRMSLLRR